MRIMQFTGQWKPTAPMLRFAINDRHFSSVEKNWRRGQESNLHSLSAGGFQDRCTTIMRPLRLGVRTIPQALGLLNGEAVAFLGETINNTDPPITRNSGKQAFICAWRCLAYRL